MNIFMLPRNIRSRNYITKYFYLLSGGILDKSGEKITRTSSNIIDDNLIVA